MILKNHTSAFIIKERLSPTSNARKKTSPNKFVEKDGVPDRIQSFEEVDSSKNRQRAGLGLLNPSEMD